jgi:spermidine/putrescine transport system substrate-binding protein
MKTFLKTAVAGLALFGFAGMAQAESELNLYNWGDYTSPEMIKKFEDTYKVKVTITDYDSNDTALAKVRAGGHGFDMVVPSANFVQTWVKEGLIIEARPDQMENFKNVDPTWVNVSWDEGRRYTVPWLWGLTGIGVNSKAYSGDVNTAAVFLDPPAELVGKINVVPEMNDVMYMAIRYMGGKWCTDDKEVLKKVQAKLKEAKPKWLAMDYSAHEKMASREYSAVYYWNGAMLRARLQNDEVKFGYPKEGFPFFMDSLAILKDAKNVENAKLFMNFIMLPENAAMLSNFAKYANGIKGSDAFMDKEMKGAAEITPTAEQVALGEFLLPCAPEVNEIYTKIWTDLLK